MPRRRRWLWLLSAAFLLLAGLALVAAPLAAHLIATRALPRVEKRLGRTVRVGDVKVRWGYVELVELTLDGAGAPAPLSAPRIRVGFRILPLLTGRVALTRVTLESPHLEIVRSDSGEDNISSLIERLRAERGSGAERAGSGRSGPDEVEVIAGSVTASDDALGSVEIAAVDALLLREGGGTATFGDVEIKMTSGPSARARRLVASIALSGGKLVSAPSLQVEGGDVRVWKGFAVSGVQGGIKPEAGAVNPARPPRVAIDLQGGYGGVDKILWSARGWAEPSSRSGELHLVAARFDLGQLAPILVDTPIQHPSEAEVDARLNLTFRGDAIDPRHTHDALDFDGSFHLLGLTVFHPRLGPQPIRRLGFNATTRGRLEPRAHTLHVESAEVDFHGVHARLALDVEKLEKLGQVRRAAVRSPAAVAPAVRTAQAATPVVPADFPAFKARLSIDPVPCQRVLEALPPELVPNLRGFRLDGIFRSEIHASVDTDHLDEVDLGSVIGIDGCKVREAPETVSSTRLAADFQHAVEVAPGNWITFGIGRDNPNFVPITAISRHLINSIMTTEDSNFLQHHGFIGREFRSALRTNLEHGYFRLGASSITMQTVKNVLLTSDKTLSRKLQELFLTWYLEHQLSKARILEIYFNVIEFGPGIYGIGRAAHHYFGHSASELQPREAAFFSSILPSPKRRYTHFCNGPALDQKWELYLNRILRRMHERGRLTDAEFEAAMASTVTFDRKEALPQARCLEMVRRMTAGGLGGTAVATAGEALPSAANAELDDPPPEDDQ